MTYFQSLVTGSIQKQGKARLMWIFWVHMQVNNLVNGVQFALSP